MIETKMVIGHCAHMTSKPEKLLPADLYEQMRPENIGHRLKLLRVAHDMSPSEMADMLNIERTYWSRFEGGKRAVSDAVAALLVSKFGVTLDFLILGRWDKLPLDLAERLRATETRIK